MKFLATALFVGIAACAAIPAAEPVDIEARAPPVPVCQLTVSSFHALTQPEDTYYALERRQQPRDPGTVVGFALYDKCHDTNDQCTYNSDSYDFQRAYGGACQRGTKHFNWYRANGVFNLDVLNTTNHVLGSRSFPLSEIKRYQENGHYYSKYVGPTSFILY